MNKLEILMSMLDLKQLKKIQNSIKEYIVFDVLNCNSFTYIKIIETNNYNRYKNISNDGYSCIIENNKDLLHYVVKAISCSLV